MRLYRILEKKISIFNEAPIFQKVILEQMRNNMFTLQGYVTEYTDTVEGLIQLNRELYAKHSVWMIVCRVQYSKIQFITSVAVKAISSWIIGKNL
jgi:hypothetical protein